MDWQPWAMTAFICVVIDRLLTESFRFLCFRWDRARFDDSLELWALGETAASKTTRAFCADPDHFAGGDYNALAAFRLGSLLPTDRFALARLYAMGLDEHSRVVRCGERQFDSVPDDLSSQAA